MKITALIILSMLIAIGIWNSPPSTVLPDGTEHRKLNPGEHIIKGMIPVTSNLGDWYDGTNWYDSNRHAITLNGSYLTGDLE